MEHLSQLCDRWPPRAPRSRQFDTRVCKTPDRTMRLEESPTATLGLRSLRSTTRAARPSR
eukprot:4533471-Pyramimonas_sp.AAC.1